MIESSQIRRPNDQENIMKMTIKHIAPWLAAAAIGGAIGIAPVANADPGSAPVSQARFAANPAAAAPAPFGTGEDPLVPDGPNPYIPYQLGYINLNHDEGNTSNGFVDLPF
jgi:hypothetical protein